MTQASSTQDFWKTDPSLLEQKTDPAPQDFWKSRERTLDDIVAEVSTKQTMDRLAGLAPSTEPPTTSMGIRPLSPDEGTGFGRGFTHGFAMALPEKVRGWFEDLGVIDDETLRHPGGFWGNVAGGTVAYPVGGFAHKDALPLLGFGLAGGATTNVVSKLARPSLKQAAVGGLVGGASGGVYEGLRTTVQLDPQAWVNDPVGALGEIGLAAGQGAVANLVPGAIVGSVIGGKQRAPQIDPKTKKYVLTHKLATAAELRDLGESPELVGALVKTRLAGYEVDVRPMQFDDGSPMVTVDGQQLMFDIRRSRLRWEERVELDHNPEFIKAYDQHLARGGERMFVDRPQTPPTPDEIETVRQSLTDIHSDLRAKLQQSDISPDGLPATERALYYRDVDLALKRLDQLSGPTGRIALESAKVLAGARDTLGRSIEVIDPTRSKASQTYDGLLSALEFQPTIRPKFPLDRIKDAGYLAEATTLTDNPAAQRAIREEQSRLNTRLYALMDANLPFAAKYKAQQEIQLKAISKIDRILELTDDTPQGAKSRVTRAVTNAKTIPDDIRPAVVEAVNKAVDRISVRAVHATMRGTIEHLIKDVRKRTKFPERKAVVEVLKGELRRIMADPDAAPTAVRVLDAWTGLKNSMTLMLSLDVPVQRAALMKSAAVLPERWSKSLLSAAEKATTVEEFKKIASDVAAAQEDYLRGMTSKQLQGLLKNLESNPQRESIQQRLSEITGENKTKQRVDPETVGVRAIQYNGKVYEGKVVDGFEELHPQIAERVLKEIPQDQHLLFAEAFAKDELSGFVSSKGNYLTRDEAEAIAKAVSSENKPLTAVEILERGLQGEVVPEQTPPPKKPKPEVKPEATPEAKPKRKLTPEEAHKLVSMETGLSMLRELAKQDPKDVTPEKIAEVERQIEEFKTGGAGSKNNSLITESGGIQPGQPTTTELSVRGFRGVPSGPKRRTIAGTEFYTPDRKVAEAYAAGGTVIERTLDFKNPLRVKNWIEGKKALGLPKPTSMEQLLNAARDAGHDGVVFENHNGKPEYVDLNPPKVDTPLSPILHTDPRTGYVVIDQKALKKALDTLPTDQLLRLRDDVKSLVHRGNIAKDLQKEWLGYDLKDDLTAVMRELNRLPDRSRRQQRTESLRLMTEMVVDPVQYAGWLEQKNPGGTLHKRFYEAIVEPWQRHEYNRATSLQTLSETATKELGINAHSVRGLSKLASYVGEEIAPGLRRDQAMWIYALSRDEGRAQALIQDGISVRGKTIKGPDVQAAIDQLSAKDRAFVDRLKMYFQENPFVEKAYSNFERLFGYSPSRVRGWFTSRRAQTAENLQADFGGWTLSLLDEVDPLRARTTKAGSPFDVDQGFVQSFLNVSDRLSMFAEVGPEIHRAQRLFLDQGFKQTFVSKYGQARYDWLQRYLTNIHGQVGHATSTLDQWINRLTTARAVSKTGLNLFSALKQSLHLMTLYGDGQLDASAITQAVKEGAWASKAVGDRMLSESGMAFMRYKSGQWLRSMIAMSGDESQLPTKLGAISHNSMVLQATMDRAVMKVAYRAAELTARRRGLTGEALRQETNKLFYEAAGRTQPGDNPLFATELEVQAKRQPLLRGTMMFQREQNRVYNVVRRRVVEAVQNPSRENLGRAGRAVMFGLAAQTLGVLAINYVRDQVFAKNVKPENVVTSGVVNLLGMYYLAGPAEELVEGLISGRKWGREQDLGPIAGIASDFVRGVVAAAEAFKAGDEDLKSGVYRGESKAGREAERAVDKALSAVSGVLGLPLWSLWHQGRGLYRWTREDLILMTELEAERERLKAEGREGSPRWKRIEEVKDRINTIHRSRESGLVQKDEARRRIIDELRRVVR